MFAVSPFLTERRTKMVDAPILMIGSGNLQKQKLFQGMFSAYQVTVTAPPAGLPSPEENGHTAVENAALKAAYYGQYADYVLCADSGLLFLDLSEDDPRQPGLHVRTPQGIRLDDEEMITYWADRVRALGGRVRAAYVDGTALKTPERVLTLLPTREEMESTAFYLTDQVVPERKPGWPLDSISYDADGRNFLDEERKPVQAQWGYSDRLVAFVVEKMGLKKIHA